MEGRQLVAIVSFERKKVTNEKKTENKESSIKTVSDNENG